MTQGVRVIADRLLPSPQIAYAMYSTYASYLTYMKGVETMGIMQLRKALGQRIDAAFFHGEPTIIKNEKKDEPRAALIPYSWLDELYELRERYKQESTDPDG